MDKKELKKLAKSALVNRFEDRKASATSNFDKMKIEHDALLYTQGMRRAFAIMGIDLTDELDDNLIAFENER